MDGNTERILKSSDPRRENFQPLRVHIQGEFILVRESLARDKQESYVIH